MRTTPPPLRILLLCHSFNSLSQRLFAALRAAGHEVSVELDIADAVTQEAVDLFQPDLLLAPFLKRRIPETIWRRLPCWIIHPGPPGDQGPSALDRAVLAQASQWGVTLLQAEGEFDAGPVWGSALFALRPGASKSSLYRREVAEAAEGLVLAAVQGFAELKQAGVAAEQMAAKAGADRVPGQFRPSLPQAERALDWHKHSTAELLARLNSADGQPGVLDELFGQPCRLWDAHAADAALLQTLPPKPPGTLQGWRDGALLRRTLDGGLWLGQAQRMAEGAPDFKLPCTQLFAAECQTLPELPVALLREPGEWGELRYEELGEPGARVGLLSFEFYNGAMSVRQCRALAAALQQVRQRPTQLLVLLGGQDFFSNGIHLNCIEAASLGLGEAGAGSAADASWANINAMNDVALALITMTERLTVAALRGNAGAGGAFLALAADEVWAHEGVLLNPHYKNMGNLYGSEYWSYLLPQRLGEQGARRLMQQRLPLRAAAALQLGLIERVLPGAAAEFLPRLREHALALAQTYNLAQRIALKQARRAADEAQRPLADYRKEELSRMHRNFYGFDPSYHVARYHFVHKLAHAWTPRHLALHR
ncbi:putative two-component system hydrogenase maturation factor HypX/HoxX [Paucibacter oligotrophus]|uniref:Putative two-component system hydrogenase maturation factor HypX/HoxX n=1 Tax=Roseateles oligotrophus TaxID=1769250 RepID=A0A840L6G3_9BURK|nr:enoyl-CoA hydratase-related protein [Roseateles oligotrophus]MBB4843760.1 putative two-component system hydrogenase maturation factor HypX/HoxX [Roseateles oligotrophus]